VRPKWFSLRARWAGLVLGHLDVTGRWRETLAQAARTLALEPSAFQLRYLQTATEIAAEHTSTSIFPLPIEFFRPFIHAAATGVATPAPRGSCGSLLRSLTACDGM
jgi:hypothetical protein